MGVFSKASIEWITFIGKFMIAMALSGIGLNADFKKMLKSGYKPLLLGFIVWIVVSITSIAIQYVFSQV